MHLHNNYHGWHSLPATVDGQLELHNSSWQKSSTRHFDICSLILFIVTNTFSIIKWRQNHLDMFRSYVAKTTESFSVPSYYLLLLEEMISWQGSWSWCHHGKASQKDWEWVCHGGGACKFNKVRVQPKKFILQTAANGWRSNLPKASPLK